MSDRKFMEIAIDEARKSSEPLKCGVVIVKDGKIISEAYNSQRKDHNATAHAEIKAIAEAGKKLRSKDLEGCTIYCTCESCMMCLSAMTFAKIRKLVFGVSLREVSPKLIDIGSDSFLEKSPYKFEVVKNFMVDECRNLLSSG